jgi:hypothetical protein
MLPLLLIAVLSYRSKLLRLRVCSIWKALAAAAAAAATCVSTELSKL